MPEFYHENLLKNIKDFIDIKSTTGDYHKALDFIYDLSNKLELQVLYEKNGNLLLKKRGLPFSGIVFSGHYDTVRPYIPLSIKRPDTICGRGTVDMKSSILCMMYTCHLSRESSPVLAFTCDEEVDSDGAIDLSKEMIRLKDDIKGIVVGEPTELNVCSCHSGRAVYHMKVFGDTFHASRGNKNNIIYRLNRILDRLEKMPQKTSELLGKETLTPVSINTYPEESWNVTPESIDVIIDRRKKTILEDYMEDIEQIKDFLHKGIDFEGFDISLYERKKNHTLPYFCDDDIFIDKIINISSSVINGDGKQKGFTATCDAAWYKELGPVVICGPGDLAMAHTPEEEISVLQISSCIDIYSKINKEI